jgi:hypothetical protein
MHKIKVFKGLRTRVTGSLTRATKREEYEFQHKTDRRAHEQRKEQHKEKRKLKGFQRVEVKYRFLSASKVSSLTNAPISIGSFESLERENTREHGK